MAETFSISSDYSAWWLANSSSSEVSIMQVFLPGKLSSKSLAKGIIWVQKQKPEKQRKSSNASATKKKKKEYQGDFFSLSDFSFTFSKAP